MESSHHGSGISTLDIISPWAALIALVTSAVYVYATGPMQAPLRTRVSFVTSMLILYLSIGPLNAIGHEYLFSAHMLQQSLLVFVFPPLLLAGIPRSILISLLKFRVIRFLLVGANSLVMAFLFNALLSFYHFPFLFDTLMASEWGIFFHVLLIILALNVWMTILPVLPEYNRLSGLKKIGFILVNGVLLYPVCAMIIFSSEPMFAAYENAPLLFQVLKPLDDQQLGGIIMKLVQEGALAAAIWYTFVQWRREEQEKERLATGVS